MKRLQKIALLSFSLVSLAYADTVTAEFIGTSGPLQNGIPVLPYTLSIDGVYVSADCYDFYDEVGYGQVWTAQRLTLQEAETTGRFSAFANAIVGYEEIAILSSFSTPTAQEKIDLQDTIWDVFDPIFTPDPAMVNYLNEAKAELNSFDYTKVEFIEAPGIQTFVVPNVATTPEPPTWSMPIIGMVLIAFSKLKRKVTS